MTTLGKRKYQLSSINENDDDNNHQNEVLENNNLITERNEEFKGFP
jgi:hypothetical protein